MVIWEGYSRKGLDVKDDNIVFLNVLEEPFKIYGISNDKKSFHRIPDEKAALVSEGVADKNRAPTGGRVRFATDSASVAVRVTMKEWCGAPHITPLAYTGFDLYAGNGGKEEYAACFYPALDGKDGYEGIKRFGNCGMREYTLNLPLFNEIYELYIGVEKGSSLVSHNDYRIEKPVVFYGSSITQGVGASRPGTSYESVISRNLDCNYINLGFAGCAKGEEEIAEYISEIDMSAFIMDYDHNAPDSEHLKKTHYKFFKKVRENNSNIPIILITKPDGNLGEEDTRRRTVVLETYLKARSGGDKNVYFIDGYQFFAGKPRGDCTVDGCHPNDLGFCLMAEKIGAILGKIL